MDHPDTHKINDTSVPYYPDPLLCPATVVVVIIIVINIVIDSSSRITVEF